MKLRKSVGLGSVGGVVTADLFELSQDSQRNRNVPMLSPAEIAEARLFFSTTEAKGLLGGNFVSMTDHHTTFDRLRT